mmetsp:Transcript_147258/g.274301  ORF Transcript_147258/g.274301 Transcript_147258/m.274301 type:complete len:556 (-) Transcript_147258:58-1725(-)
MQWLLVVAAELLPLCSALASTEPRRLRGPAPSHVLPVSRAAGGIFAQHLGRQAKQETRLERSRLVGTVAHSASGRARAKLKSVLASEVGIVHKTEYWGQIYVGTPAKKFTVIFDTGSGNLILPSSACLSAGCQPHEKYEPKSSESSVQVGKKGISVKDDPDQKKDSTIKFGTGKIHGQFYKDNICLAEGSACMTANFVGTDMESDSPFAQCSFDGIMGLGFKDLSMGDGFNMVDDIVAQGSLAKNQISVYLTDTGGSEISFGGYKRSQAASELFWVPVSRQSYWQIGIDDVTFNNARTGLCEKCQVAVDTGTSLLAGPSEVVQALGSRLDVRDDCSNFDSLPLLGFAIGDKVLNLKPDDYIDNSGHSCSVSMMTLDVPPPKGPLFIFGDPFLRRFLTVYDRDGPRVGFAVAQHEGLLAEDPERLIARASASAGAGGSAEAAASSAWQAEKPAADDVSALDSVTRALREEDTQAKHGWTSGVRDISSHDDLDDPMKALRSEEGAGWTDIFKDSSRTVRTGMLQTTQAQEAAEDQIVSISLTRAGKQISKRARAGGS